MKHNVLDFLRARKNTGLKSLAVLVDPDKISGIEELVRISKDAPPDLFLVGSSFSGDETIRQCIARLRSVSGVPVVLFPGNIQQVVSEADALLLLSVISSRNAELLIGKHVEASLRIRQSGLEIIPTGYLLVESGRLTTVQYLSQSIPLPRTKPELAAATALAGEQLGQRIIYLEAGSGAELTVPEALIAAVATTTGTILFTGGGITSASQLNACYSAGCDVAVIGNALESTPEKLTEFARVRNTFNL